MKVVLVGVVAAGLVVLLASGFLGAANAPGQAVSATSPVASGAPNAGGVTAQINMVNSALAQARLSGKPVQLTLTFSEGDLTTSAAAYFPQSASGATLTDPVVRLRTGQLVLDMSAQIAVVRTTAEAIATVTVWSGRPVTTVTNATIGGAALPQATSDQVAAELNDALSAGLPAKFVVVSVTVGTGVMSVVGVATP